MRPPAIQRFARLYPIWILLGIVVNVLTWHRSYAVYARTEMGDAGPFLLVALLSLGTAVSVTLWFLVTRRHNNIARWVIVGIFGISAVSICWSLVGGRMVFDIPGILALVRVLIQAFAVRELLRAESAVWFGSKAVTPAQEPEDAQENAGPAL
jgi:hypothetical protein